MCYKAAPNCSFLSHNKDATVEKGNVAKFQTQEMLCYDYPEQNKLVAHSLEQHIPCL